MKRSTVSILIVAVLVIAGLLLALAVGSRPAPAAPGSPTLAATLTEREYLTLAATDIWAIPTPLYTPVIPTERAFPPRPTFPLVTPPPTPTLLPDPGVRMAAPVEIPIVSALRVAEGESFRLTCPDLDDHTVAGVVGRGDTAAVVTIDVETQQERVVVEASRAWIHDSHISGANVVWSQTEYDGPISVLYSHNLQTGQVIRIAENAYDIDISGPIVVWRQLEEDWDIWGYDLDKQAAFPVVTRFGYQMGPLISGRWIVYRDEADQSDAEVGLYVVNLDTREDIRLGTVYASLQQYVPPLYAIDAPWVVWASEAELHLYNLDTRTAHTVTVESCISPATGQNESPRLSRPGDLVISGNTVLFVCSQWMGYDIERGVFFSIPIYTPEAWQMAAQGRLAFNRWTLAGDRLVWVMTEDLPDGQEQGHIYTAQIEHSP